MHDDGEHGEMGISWEGCFTFVILLRRNISCFGRIIEVRVLPIIVDLIMNPVVDLNL